MTKTINIVCPSDYDGTIFYSGYNSLELDSERAEVNMGEKLHTFDELPFMDDDKELFYFTYEKPDSTGKSFWGTYDATTTSSSESSSEPSRPAK